ncbi:MAG: hypothetical protein IKA67_01295 [Clostridia bacterium]|nr:hypothetical protein [Clostridia bacterium]
MKKVIALTLALMMCMLLVACAGISDLFGGGSNNGPATPPADPPRTPTIRGDSVTVFGAKSGFDIVYPAGSDEYKGYADAMAELIAGRKLKAPVVVDDATKTEGQCELLVGDTGRALSAEAKAAVDAKIAEDPYSLHWVWMYKDGQLALYASSADAYEKAVGEITGKYYSAGSVIVKVDTKDYGFFKIAHPVVENDLVYLFGSTEDFAIVYGDEAAAGSFAGALEALGVKVPEAVSAADKDETLCEILIGDTGRALSAVAESMIQNSTLTRDAWAWVYSEGQFAIYAVNATAYESAIAEFTSRYCKDGVVAIPVDAAFEGGSVVHDAYMSYEEFANFYDGYVDPFGMKDDDYKQMTITRTRSAYEISYKDEHGGTFIATFVERAWGIWAMGGMTYIEKDGTRHNMVPDNTDSEFVLRIGAKTPVTLRSGNHGNYPGDTSWQPYDKDETSQYNDKMLDMTFYDAKSGNEIILPKVGTSATVNGLRIVMHHNIYEISYKQNNILANVERSYLYNGYDIMCDSKLYMTQDVKLENSFSCMLPVDKKYGNCAMFYEKDGNTVLMHTPNEAYVSLPEIAMGADADYIDIWGESNPALHVKIRLYNTEDQFRNSVENSEDKGYAGLRNMPANGMGGPTNKIYCSCFSAGGEMEHGESLNFRSGWSFAYEPDFVAPDRTPDRTVGYD